MLFRSLLRGRRGNRTQADLDWLALGARVFRLPGIYGPGRSALDRVAEGKAHRIDLPDQVFSRVHVDDIVSGVIAGFAGPTGAYNLADDYPCSQNRVIEAACDLAGVAWPPLQSLEAATFRQWHLPFMPKTAGSPMARLIVCSAGRPPIRPMLRACER